LLYPDDLKYSKEHEWIKVTGDAATIGITHHAQDSLGDIVFVELPEVGAQFKQMEEFGVVESVKTVSTLYCPVSGTVVEANKSLVSNPELINESPYDKGWLIKVKTSSPKEAEKLLGPEEYQSLIGE
jgi:glycine cleavage system H protein